MQWIKSSWSQIVDVGKEEGEGGGGHTTRFKSTICWRIVSPTCITQLPELRHDDNVMNRNDPLEDDFLSSLIWFNLDAMDWNKYYTSI